MSEIWQRVEQPDCYSASKPERWTAVGVGSSWGRLHPDRCNNVERVVGDRSPDWYDRGDHAWRGEFVDVERYDLQAERQCLEFLDAYWQEGRGERHVAEECWKFELSGRRQSIERAGRSEFVTKQQQR